MNLVLYTSISEFLIGGIAVILGLFTWLYNPRERKNQLIGLMFLAVAIWSISWGIQAPITDKAHALFWARMLNFGAIFIPIFFAHWVSILLNKDQEKKNKIILYLGYFASLIFASFAFSPYFVSTVVPKHCFPFYSEPGPLYIWYVILSYGGLVGYAIYNLLSSYKQVDMLKRAQIRYVLLGVIIGFGGGATNYFLFYNIEIFPFGNPLVVVGISLLAYSIIRYRLMDIYWVLGRIGVYILSFATIVLYALGITYLSRKFNLAIPLTGLVTFISVTATLLFLYIFHVYEKIAGRYFYYTSYTLQQVIKKLVKELNKTIDLNKLSNLVTTSLLGALNLEKGGIILREVGTEGFKVQKLVNFEQEDILSFLDRRGRLLDHYFRDTKNIIVRTEIPFIIQRLKPLNSQIKDIKISRLKSIYQEMDKLKIELLLPLFIREKLIGLIIFGKKLSKNPYSVQDIKLLSGLSSQLSIAFNNAMAYEEIEKRKEELEKWYRLTVGREIRMAELKKEIEKKEEEIKKIQEKRNKS